MGKDWGDMLQADPALADASKAYEATYGYTDTNNVDGTTQEQIETTTMTYSADAMASYKAACEASTAGAVWWELPTGTTVSCATTDGSYTFDIAYEISVIAGRPPMRVPRTRPVHKPF